MGRKIIKQPNGKYAVWSTVIDNFIFYDATPEEIIEKYLKDSRETITESVMRQVKDANIKVAAENGSNKNMIYYLETIKNLHGEGEYNHVKKMLLTK